MEFYMSVSSIVVNMSSPEHELSVLFKVMGKHKRTEGWGQHTALTNSREKQMR